MLAKAALLKISFNFAFGQASGEFCEERLVALGHVQAGGANQVVEDQQAIEQRAVWVGVLRIHQVKRLGQIAHNFQVVGGGPSGDIEGSSSERLGRRLRLGEEHDASVGRKRPLVVASDGEQGVELITFVVRSGTKRDEHQLFRDRAACGRAESAALT